MPSFDTNTPRADIKILDIKDLTIPRPYVGGHTLSAEEAKFMNDRLSSIMVNGYGGDIRRALFAIDNERLVAYKAGEWTGAMTNLPRDWKEGQPKLRAERPAWATVADLDGDEWADHQANLDEKFAAYQVGGANGRQPSEKDPLEKVVRDIAVRETKDALTKAGHKVKNWMDKKDEEHGSQFNRLVVHRITKHRDRLYALAKAQVEGRPEEDPLDGFDIPEGLQAEEGREAA